MCSVFDKGVLHMKSTMLLFVMVLFLGNPVGATPPMDHDHMDHSSTEGPGIMPAPVETPAPAVEALKPAEHKKTSHDKLIDSRESRIVERSRIKEHDEIVKLLQKNKDDLYYTVNNSWKSPFWGYRLKLEDAYHLAMDDLDNEDKQKAYDDVKDQTEKALKKYYAKAKSLQDRINSYNSVYDPDLDNDVIQEMFKYLETGLGNNIKVEVEDDVITIAYSDNDNIAFDMNSIEDEDSDRQPTTLTPASHAEEHSAKSWLDDDDDVAEGHDKKESEGTCSENEKDRGPSTLEKVAAWGVTLGAGYLAVDTARKGPHFQSDMWKAGQARVDTDLAHGRNPQWGMQMMSAAYNYDWTTPVAGLVDSTLMSVNSLLDMSYGHGRSTMGQEEFTARQEERNRQRQWDQFDQWRMMREMNGNGTMSSNTTTNMHWQEMLQGLNDVAKNIPSGEAFFDNFNKYLDDAYQRSSGGVSTRQMQDLLTTTSNLNQALGQYAQGMQMSKQMIDQMKQLWKQNGNMWNNVNNSVNGQGGVTYDYTRTTTNNANSNWQGTGNGNTWQGNSGQPQMPGPQLYAPNNPQNGFQMGGTWVDPSGRGGQGQIYRDPTGFGGQFQNGG